MKIFGLIISILFLQQGLLANEIKENCEKVIREFFNDEVVFDYYEYEINNLLIRSIEYECGQKFFKSKIVVWEIFKDDTLHSLGLLDNVYGKSLPITFMTLFDKSGNVLKSDIIKYRESYGGGVASRNWLKQFLGMNKSSPFTTGQDIQIVSGATISSHSVSRGIRKLTFLIEPILKSYENRTASAK